MKILLVEDEVKIRQGLRSLVESILPGQAELAEAANGREAWERLKTQDGVDLVITDIRMNEMDGIELLKRAQQAYPDIVFVIVSGYDEFVYAREALRHGVADYLLKPIDRVEMARVLTRIRDKLAARKGERAEGDPNPGGEDNERLIIRKVKELVNDSLDRDISLQFLAERVYLHPKYLSDMFKRETGQNLSDYVTERRMNRARKLLKETALKIPDIAELCGFANHKYFRALFKQQTGATPTEYRED
ncbi:response regulator transcription factor [Cohnella cellulosilytica]|uniref:Response regulator n=1 Tax=Cohnella cellulosilytica TaxID=986710 RepID=A0ABW2F9I1_9BACL